MKRPLLVLVLAVVITTSFVAKVSLDALPAVLPGVIIGWLLHLSIQEVAEKATAAASGLVVTAVALLLAGVLAVAVFPNLPMAVYLFSLLCGSALRHTWTKAHN